MKHKKLAAALLAGLLAVSVTACGNSGDSTASPSAGGETTTITVGASPAPHAEILEVAKDILAEQGITLEIQQFTDYVMPNNAVEDGSIDANYFQHITYMNDFNEENGTHLVSVAEIHYEPFGLYAGKTDSLDALADGAQIGVPNDATNEARALLLLEQEGLITLAEDAGLSATVLDIVENPKNLQITEAEAAMLPRTLDDVDLAVINSNFAMEAKLNPTKDALFIEAKDSPYANIVAIRKGDENRPEIQKLMKALNSPEVKKFIEEKYQGAIIPAF